MMGHAIAKPVYRCNQKQLRQIRVLLQNYDMWKNGVFLRRGEVLACELMDKHLTVLQLDYLQRYYRGGKTHKQIAAELGRNASTVTRMVNKGRENLLEVIKELETIHGG